MITLGPVISKGDNFYDHKGDIIPLDAIIVYANRKEIFVDVQDEEIAKRIKEHLKTADWYFPSIKFLTKFLDEEKLEYEIKDYRKSTRL